MRTIILLVATLILGGCAAGTSSTKGPGGLEIATTVANRTGPLAGYATVASSVGYNVEATRQQMYQSAWTAVSTANPPLPYDQRKPVYEALKAAAEIRLADLDGVQWNAPYVNSFVGPGWFSFVRDMTTLVITNRAITAQKSIAKANANAMTEAAAITANGNVEAAANHQPDVTNISLDGGTHDMNNSSASTSDADSYSEGSSVQNSNTAYGGEGGKGGLGGSGGTAHGYGGQGGSGGTAYGGQGGTAYSEGSGVTAKLNNGNSINVEQGQSMQQQQGNHLLQDACKGPTDHMSTGPCSTNGFIPD